ncbi:MAG TPA: hypothetical protein DC049_14075, partial [Spirochaetia bacterium]|nr:hypothetical protein [Spirochaetia bacterium]
QIMENNKYKQAINQLVGWKKDGIWPSYDFEKMGEHIEKKGLVLFKQIGSALVRIASAHALVDEIISELSSHPEKWLNKEFILWRNICQKKSL